MNIKIIDASNYRRKAEPHVMKIERYRDCISLDVYSDADQLPSCHYFTHEGAAMLAREIIAAAEKK